MPIFSKGFLNGKRDIGGGASPRWELAPPEKKVYPGKWYYTQGPPHTEGDTLGTK
jgi:hypothetical protein